MSHSKRNTSLAFFTNHERSLLKSSWGSQATRLSRDSFLPFASCQLCLQIARDPVACASHGDIFCRECIVNNLLAQGKEIKRIKKEDEHRQKVAQEEELGRAAEEKQRAVEDFEKTMMGLEGEEKKKSGAIGTRLRKDEELEQAEGRGVKRKFELDEDEMLKNAREERAKARKALDDEKSAKPTLPSFWVPSLTPSTNHSKDAKPIKLSSLCPVSSPENKHSLSLKSLVTIHFKTIPNTTSSEAPNLICPACDKNLSNTVKAVLTKPCGHVLCKPCTGKFMSSDSGPPDPHASPTKHQEAERIACFVCDTDLLGKRIGSQDSKDVPKSHKTIESGLVELKSEGTGFAHGGSNMAQKQGVAFQC